MTQVLTGLFLLFVLFFVYYVYISIRLIKVSNFRKYLLEKCAIWSIKNIDSNNISDSAIHWCYDKLPSINRMIYSIKPLKEEYWLTKEIKEKFQKQVV